MQTARMLSWLRLNGYALPNGGDEKAVATRDAVLEAVKGWLHEGLVRDVRLDTRSNDYGSSLFLSWVRTAEGNAAVDGRSVTPGQAIAAQVRAECAAQDRSSE